jgi:hypothetical protein
MKKIQLGYSILLYFQDVYLSHVQNARKCFKTLFQVASNGQKEKEKNVTIA